MDFYFPHPHDEGLLGSQPIQRKTLALEFVLDNDFFFNF